MPHFLQSSVISVDSKDITIVTPSFISTDKKENNNTLLISFWFYLTEFNAKCNQNILSLKNKNSLLNKETLNNINKLNIKIDNENNYRLKVEINNDINITIQSIDGLSIYS